MTDILQNMLLFNNVPDSFLHTCATELKHVVPQPFDALIQSHVQRGIESNNRVLRFFILFTAMAHSETIRGLFSNGESSAQYNAWIEATVPSEWERFFMGTDKHGQPMCAGIGDAKYGTMLDFVARMLSEYVMLGWNEPPQNES